MIKPTRGRVVLFTPSKDDQVPHGGEAIAAIIAHVHSDSLVNLTVFDAFGRVHARPSIQLLGDDAAIRPKEGPYAEWMPYQKGQAAKTEAAEGRLAAYTSLASQHVPHQQRVIDEKTELDEKLTKLSAFVGTPIFSGLAEEERERLAAQARAMGEYSRILGDRIAAFA
ncbi:crAss001_48 related protein [Paraburkholderia silvatlantica]|uniref:Uncharacterized protein n=1 Tax=Paraburkholderia silvatlantica TaxID=321895 RepID=A0ABR6FLS7_9BURK|nr:hypothetical protein [Paraburkholderia silvatlantica]MBB2928375.1 hypothetical protein [Paraburkholderia silvatlantica]PVY34580.1 hypothetical protein C7411_107116 [Paraburkholderia silvatlantica]PXW38795.1 hypothetical protein C7413_107116 [Paraburkholderia silvatlantica]